MTTNYLILMTDTKGNDTENATSFTETYLVNYNAIKDGFDLEYPRIGCNWRGPSMSSSYSSDFICTSISFNREAKKFYSSDSAYSAYNGSDCVTLEATYSINYNTQAEKFTKRVSSSGYKSYKINYNFGKWLYTLDSTTEGVTKKSLPVAQDQMEFEYKVPISELTLTTNIVGNVDEVAYNSLRNKVNNAEFQGRPIGTVLYDSYSIQPKFKDDTVVETQLSLTFKILPFDWNYDWRNRVQFTNSATNSKMFWQSEFPDRADYIYNYTDGSQSIPYNAYLYDCVKSTANGGAVTYYTYAEIKELLNGMPIWTGSLLRKKKDDGTYEYVRAGNVDLGTCGWDKRYWLKNNSLGELASNRQYLYEYADFSSLLSGYPVINEYTQPNNSSE